MPTESAFPTTQATWCETLLDARVAGATRARALEDMRVALMARYAGPLAVFVRGSSLSKFGEPAEIVNGFFASRLSDARFLEAWAASGMRLRRWLMNGILFYGQGLARDRARAAARGGAVEPRELDRREGDGTTAEADFDRAGDLSPMS